MKIERTGWLEHGDADEWRCGRVFLTRDFPFLCAYSGEPNRTKPYYAIDGRDITADNLSDAKRQLKDAARG